MERRRTPDRNGRDDPSDHPRPRAFVNSNQTPSNSPSYQTQNPNALPGNPMYQPQGLFRNPSPSTRLDQSPNTIADIEAALLRFNLGAGPSSPTLQWYWETNPDGYGDGGGIGSNNNSSSNGFSPYYVNQEQLPLNRMRSFSASAGLGLPRPSSLLPLADRQFRGLDNGGAARNMISLDHTSLSNFHNDSVFYPQRRSQSFAELDQGSFQPIRPNVYSTNHYPADSLNTYRPRSRSVNGLDSARILMSLRDRSQGSGGHYSSSNGIGFNHNNGYYSSSDGIGFNHNNGHHSSSNGISFNNNGHYSSSNGISFKNNNGHYLSSNGISINNNNGGNGISVNSGSRQAIYSSLDQVRGRVALVARDQEGCRFLQKLLEEERRHEHVDMIFLEIKDHISDLMVDQFGNYLMQKLFQSCTDDQITQLLLSLINRNHGHIVPDICAHPHGTRAMQKMIERFRNQEQRSLLVSALKHATVTLTKDQNGHHVIQLCLNQFPPEDTKFLAKEIADHCLDIAMNKSGCCVLQQALARSEGDIRDRLISEIISNALLIAENQFGNYVVQFIISMRLPRATAGILDSLRGSFVALSMNKYSSNVVEKCLRECEEGDSTMIISELMASDHDFLNNVLQDQFGNFVAQVALEVAQGELRSRMVGKIQNFSANLHSHPFGKNVYAKVRVHRHHHRV